MLAQSNGIAVQNFSPLRDSTGLADDPDALRSRLRIDGYVYLRGVLDREDVLSLVEPDPRWLKPWSGDDGN